MVRTSAARYDTVLSPLFVGASHVAVVTDCPPLRHLSRVSFHHLLFTNALNSLLSATRLAPRWRGQLNAVAAMRWKVRYNPLMLGFELDAL